IAELTREEYGRPRASEAEITRIALAHHLVSQYTSLVAIDDAPDQARANGFPRLVNQPNEAPEGVDLRSAGGSYAPSTPAGSASVTGDVDGDGIPDAQDQSPEVNQHTMAPA